VLPSLLQEDLGDGDVDNPGVEDSVSHGLVDWLTASLGQSTQVNAWAGPNHWKYRKPRGKEQTFFLLSRMA